MPIKKIRWLFLLLATGLGVLTILLLGLSGPGEASDEADSQASGELEIIQQAALLPAAPPSGQKPGKVLKIIPVVVTAYSSSVWETAGDPFITASGTRVRDGVAANNLLAFGTKIRLPAIFGEKVFVIEDRMHSKKGKYHVDIWFSSREEALKFGAHLTDMEVLAD